MLYVPGIHCWGCVETFRAGLLMEEGVGAVEGDAEAKTGFVRYRRQVTSPERIERAITQLGYRVGGRNGQKDAKRA